MNEKLKDSPTSWVDPDDAPELTADFFQQGSWTIGEKKVSAQEGAAALKKSLVTNLPELNENQLSVTLRYDADVIEAFKASGTGWQKRMNQALREWLKTHSMA